MSTTDLKSGSRPEDDMMGGARELAIPVAETPGRRIMRAVTWFALYLVLCAAAFLTALPFVWMVFGSFKTRQEVEEPGFVPERWKPAEAQATAPPVEKEDLSPVVEVSVRFDDPGPDFAETDTPPQADFQFSGASIDETFPPSLWQGSMTARFDFGSRSVYTMVRDLALEPGKPDTEQTDHSFEVRVRLLDEAPEDVLQKADEVVEAEGFEVEDTAQSAMPNGEFVYLVRTRDVSLLVEVVDLNSEAPGAAPAEDDRQQYAHTNEFDNYLIVLRMEPDKYTGKLLDVFFVRWYYNSIFTSLAITFLQVFTSAMAAYAFSRIVWPGRDYVFFLYLATMMIPGVVLMIPNYQLMVWFDFVDTYRGLVIPAAFTAFGTFLMRQFMMTIPPSLDEAARIDGASHWQTFWEVILPLSRAGLVALSIFTMLMAFQSFFWPLVMLNSENLFTLPIGLLRLDSTYGRQTELILAATVMSVLPLIVLFVLLQKQLIKGIQLGAVKG